MTKRILLCSSNPMLVKNLYGILRDEGYGVETAEHPAFAVQMVMDHSFDLVIMDAEPFGLSAEDAIQIIRAMLPGLHVLSLDADSNDSAGIPSPLDLQKLTRTIHAIAV